MTFRIPRGYDTNRTSYQELSEGVRPETSTVPMEAWTGLAAVRVDEIAHDPIVLDAGTVVGVARSGLAGGKLFPAFFASGSATIQMRHHGDGTSWGLPDTNLVIGNVQDITGGPVKPLGMVYQPIYSFILQEKFTNYKRNENVGIVTDYLVQIPCRSEAERRILVGDQIMVASTAVDDTSVLGNGSQPGTLGFATGTPMTYGQVADDISFLGSLAAWDGAHGNDFIIGRCLRNLTFATGTADAIYEDDIANVSLTTEGAAEFKALSRVQTVPGLKLAGSGTAGAPGWLLKAAASPAGSYKVMTILIRL